MKSFTFPKSNLFIQSLPVFLLLSLLFTASFVHAQEQRTISLTSLRGLFPDHVGGDKDYGGNGPSVTTSVRLKISSDKKKLLAEVNFHAKETKSDWTEARKKWTKVVANAPAGYTFTRILSSSYSSARYIDRNHEMDYPRISGSLVNRMAIKGDTGGSDVGNTTKDDTHIANIYFNRARVEVKKLGGRKTTVAQSTYIGKLQRAFNATKIRLNNYTPRRHQFDKSLERAYYKPNDNYIETVFNGRPYKYKFSVPVERRDPLSLYIVDMNTNRVTASRSSNQLKMTLFFESQGKEAWSNCVNNGLCGAYGNRDVQINNARIEVFLKPKVERGKLTYDCTRVILRSVNRVDGCQDDLFAFLCDLGMGDRDSKIKSAVQNSLRSKLNDRVHKGIISEILRRNLGLTGNISDVYIDSRNGNLVITQ